MGFHSPRKSANYEKIEMAKLKLVFQKSIRQFPYKIYERFTTINYLFSPDLENYIEFDKLIGKFKIIKSLAVGQKSKSKYTKDSDIPLDGIFNYDDPSFDADETLKNIMWQNEK